jgi:hypothetical protein
MIIGGNLITTALITYLAYYKKPLNKYSLKYYKLKWGGGTPF